jgi:riboflavin kinase/FMN adenylyltransferase
LLQTLGKTHGFTVENTTTLNDTGERISSTRIREALTAGEMRTAHTLLGRDYFMSGRVAHGEKRGRTLGFPTANIHLRRRQTPLMGIFAVEIAGLAATRLPAVASIGVRPTFGGGRCLLEVHLLDFNRDIYGQHVDVYFLHKLRDEQRFDSVDALITQMHRDVLQAKRFFTIQTRPEPQDT